MDCYALTRYPQELIHYGQKLLSFWDRLFPNNREGLQRMDARSLEIVQGTCAKLSKADKLRLQKSFEDGTCFPHLGNNERRQLQMRIERTDELVPTLHTFFKDLQFIQICQKVLKVLLPMDSLKDGGTLWDAFRAIFAPTGVSKPMRYHVSETTTRNGQASLPDEERFIRGYQQLWLFAFRHWSFMVEERPRLKSRQKRAERRPFSQELASLRCTWLAHCAQQYGFSSKEIMDFLSHDKKPSSPATPIQKALSTSGQPARPWGFRHGIPTDEDISNDERSLFWDNVQWTTGLHPNTSVTSFYLRRNLFRMLFPASSLDSNPSVSQQVATGEGEQSMPEIVISNPSFISGASGQQGFQPEVMSHDHSDPLPSIQRWRSMDMEEFVQSYEFRPPQKRLPAPPGRRLVPAKSATQRQLVSATPGTSDAAGPVAVEQSEDRPVTEQSLVPQSTDINTQISRKRKHASSDHPRLPRRIPVELWGDKVETRHIVADLDHWQQFFNEWQDKLHYTFIYLRGKRYTNARDIWKVSRSLGPQTIQMVHPNHQRKFRQAQIGAAARNQVPGSVLESGPLNVDEVEEDRKEDDDSSL